ncbi:MAG: glycoside hydrolase family 127 protein [Planctomycetes bacterium]|nr:glycoside hydrolase family 127 protein [Planctomycetota bacterium]
MKLLWLIVALIATCAGTAFGTESVGGYQTKQIDGWTVHVSKALLKTEAAATETALKLLERQLAEIVRVVPAGAVSKLREVPLWISPEYPGVQPRAEYHPDAGWLRENGRNPAMAKCVEFTNVRIFEKETKRMPNFALHELAHAYHDRVLGFEQPDIVAAYERAKAGKSYENVERTWGDGRPNRKEQAYGMTNAREYFAESTEAFFSRNDFFPFDRGELHTHDPHMEHMLDRVWGVDPQPLHGLKEVPHEQVQVIGGFWGPRLKINSAVTIPHALDELEKDGHVTNFDKAAGRFDGPLRGHHAFDSDLYKALEGAIVSLAHYPNQALSRRVDNIVDRILAAQQKDGFLISYFIVNGLDKRWDDLRLEHQMYNAGHFFEMAVEQNRLSGDPKAINAAKRFADHIDSVFGPSKRYDVDGHQEVELALVKLYRATGEQRYFDLSKFFLDERGCQHGTERKPLDPATVVPPRKPEGELTADQRRAHFRAQLRWRNGRMQDHKPVVDQHEAIGHAVRAGYMYSAMADVTRFSNTTDYMKSLDSIFNDVVGRKIYVTGGVGTGQHDDEGFGDPYLLPNESAYCESCAAIANVLWQHRMALLKGEAKYADVLELSLYNGVLSGQSLSGDRFFYQNPLATRTGHSRKSWIGLSCCPTNLCRIIPQIGGLVYAQGKRKILVNLYVAGEAKLKLADGTAVKLIQQSEYPWDGSIRLNITPEAASEFALCLRIPGWVQGKPVPSDLYRTADSKPQKIGLKVNGAEIDAAPEKDGYVHLQRRWQAGDVVELELPMPIQRVYAHDKVKENQGKVALMRGPLVYCVEASDQPGVDLFRLAVSSKAGLRAMSRPDFLGGVTVLQGSALAEGKTPVEMTAIPYFAWANRNKGAMTVWVKETSDR